jgi:hypothetical protein
LTELFEIGEATKRGDIKTFDALLLKHQSSFVKIGIYLILEQIKILVYRNVFKKIYNICNTTKLNLLIFQKVLKDFLDEDIDLDEIECILSNLIFQNKLKGYISHQRRFLIVSKNDPFPTSQIIKSVSK